MAGPLPSGGRRTWRQRALAIYAVYGLAVIAAVAAACYAVGALHVYLELRYGPIQASLALAGGLLAVAAVLVAVAMAMRRRKQERTMATTAMLVAPAVAPTAIRALTSKPALGALLAAGAVALGAWLGHQTDKNRPDA